MQAAISADSLLLFWLIRNRIITVTVELEASEAMQR
jgi:hypothetical protein